MENTPPQGVFKSSAELRKFGWVMTVALGILGGVLFWRRGLAPATYGVLGAAGLFFVTAVIAPKLLGPLEWAWMKLAGVLSFIMTRVILTLAFFLAMTPVGLLMRLSGHDPLGLRRRKVDSYWKPVEPDGPGSRTHSPF